MPITPITPPTFLSTSTYIKFDSPPTSAEDYDYRCMAGAGLFDQTGAISTNYPFSGKTCVYVWGSTERRGQIKINDVLYYGGGNYNTAMCFELVENSTLSLGHGTGAGSGGTDN